MGIAVPSVPATRGMPKEMLKTIITGAIAAAFAVGGLVAIAPTSSAAGDASCVGVTDGRYDSNWDSYSFRLRNECGGYLPNMTKWEFQADSWNCGRKSGSRLNLDNHGERIRVDVSDCEAGRYSPKVKVTTGDFTSDTIYLNSFTVKKAMNGADIGTASSPSQSKGTLGSGSKLLPSSSRPVPKEMLDSYIRMGTKVVAMNAKPRWAVDLAGDICTDYQVKLKTKSPNGSVIEFVDTDNPDSQWTPKVRKGRVNVEMFLCEGDSVDVINEKGKRIATLNVVS